MAISWAGRLSPDGVLIVALVPCGAVVRMISTSAQASEPPGSGPAGPRLRRPAVSSGLTYRAGVILEFSGPVWHWRGPAPYHFVTVPAAQSDALQSVAGLVSYGWGMIPVTARIGDTEWTTALWPKDGRYVVPLKDRIRAAEGIELGDTVTVRLEIEA